MNIQDAIDWFDQQVAEGRTISINWSGGNDEGWAYFEMDGEHLQGNEYADFVVNDMYEKLDYGSWAGNFYAAGEATYDPETKCFKGTDTCSVDESAVYDISANPIEFLIPKVFAFSAVDVATMDCDCTVQMTLVGINRFEHPAEEKYFSELSEKLGQRIYDVAEKQNDEHDINNYWDEYMIQKFEMRDATAEELLNIGDPDLINIVADSSTPCYVATINQIQIQYDNSEERTMTIDLQGMLEDAEL